MSVSLAGLPTLAEIHHERARREFARRYGDDPILYALERLKVQWWAKQQEVARALLDHPRVLVKASNGIGKTHLAGGLTCWHYEAFSPGITLTTAPSDTQVKDLLWREVRNQAPAGLPLMPSAPHIEGGKFHYAKGYVARDVNAFQGRHEEHLLIIFDEAVGVRPEFWLGAESMCTGPDNLWLAICNPTDTSSEAYAAELSGNWCVISISALDHPNIAAELAGLPPPYPNAIRLEKIEQRIAEWCTPTSTPDETDVEWPPLSGQWYRPGPLFEARVLGRWPSIAVESVWSDALLAVAFRQDREPLDEPADVPCEIGCDVARFGDDMTAMHVRRGAVSLHHESHNGWDTGQTAGRLKQLANEWGQHCGIEGRRIAIKIDDDGVGGGVVDQAGTGDDKYLFLPMSAASTPIDAENYPNRRSEAWFATASRAREGRLDLSRLSTFAQRDIRLQLMAPKWKLDNQGRRVVEPKADTKKRLKRSPDDADALNLAYAFARTVPRVAPPAALTTQSKWRGVGEAPAADGSDIAGLERSGARPAQPTRQPFGRTPATSVPLASSSKWRI